MTYLKAGRCARLLCLSLLVFGFPGRARAGTFPYWGLSFGTPDRAAFHVGVSFGDHIPNQSEAEVAVGSGPVVEASIGMGAGRIGIGKSILLLTDQKRLRVLADVKAVGTRTWDEARGGSPRSTYLGVEGGLSVSFVRFTLGLSKRLEHRASGADWQFTWGTGVQIRMGGNRRDR